MFRALADGPDTVSNLSDGLRMSTQGAAKILGEMESRGYVRRTAHPTDARARLIDLTDRGRLAPIPLTGCTVGTSSSWSTRSGTTL